MFRHWYKNLIPKILIKRGFKVKVVKHMYRKMFRWYFGVERIQLHFLNTDTLQILLQLLLVTFSSNKLWNNYLLYFERKHVCFGHSLKLSATEGKFGTGFTSTSCRGKFMNAIKISSTSHVVFYNTLDLKCF